MSQLSGDQVADISHDIVDLMEADAGGRQHGIRPVHAKGTLLDGFFIPTKEAEELSTAWVFKKRCPVLARFSNSGGDVKGEDKSESGDPRGLAIRFVKEWKLSDLGTPHELLHSEHTDIITHSIDGFPAATVEDALQFFIAAHDGQAALQQYLATHAEAQEFLDVPRPTPRSYAKLKYFGVNAFKFIGPQGKETFFRYRIIPHKPDGAGVEEPFTQEEIDGLPPNYLQDELLQRLEQTPILFYLHAQIAEDGDVTDDCTERWPETRREVRLGSIILQAPTAVGNMQQDHMKFCPKPDIEGIESSDDPLLELRHKAYYASSTGRLEERPAAEE